MKSPKEFKAALKRAIRTTAINRGGHVSDIRNLSRHRKLTMETVIRLLLSFSGGGLAKELWSAGVDATPSAFVQQRQKIAPAAFREVFDRFNESCRYDDDVLYRDKFKLLAVDGTTINLSYNSSADTFLQMKTHPKGGYNALHLTPLYDLEGLTYEDVVIQAQPQMDEQAALIQMLYRNKFPSNSIILADRGLESYNVLAHFQKRLPSSVYCLIRVRQGKGAMKEIAKLPMTELDRDVLTVLTTSQQKAHKDAGYVLMQMSNKSGHKNRARWDHAQTNPFYLRMRVVRFKLEETGEYETLVTTLPREEFTIDDLKNLYKRRWGIETAFRFVKYSQNLVNLHSRSREGAEQEIYAALTMANFSSRVARQVVLQQRKENIYEYRVNLTMAMFLCKQFFRNPGSDPEKLMRDIAKYTEPVRPNRRDARNMRTKSFVSFTYRVAA